MFEFDYKSALYRRNNFGQPCVWYIEEDKVITKNSISIYHGIVGKTIIKEHVFVKDINKINQEITSRINAKLKTGYKFLDSLKDNVSLPVEGELLNYLNAYLPTDRTTSDGTLLPMLAKVYDNTNNKLFKKCPMYLGQWKINGLRCFISAEKVEGDLFTNVHLKFQSREGTYWNSLHYLEEYLLSIFDKNLINRMIDEHYILDGELYLPGHSVNEINHFVKDPVCSENKFLQYWCYDIAIDDTSADLRHKYLYDKLPSYRKWFYTKEQHLNNKERLVCLPSFNIYNDTEAINARDKFIEQGFEGLILRNPLAEYQYGKRNQSMIKFKRATDGKFTIVDIYPEGVKRPDIPLLLCKNDINSETFECHLSTSLNHQREILRNKENYIGSQVYITYGERSGVNQLPFHIKDVMFTDVPK